MKSSQLRKAIGTAIAGVYAWWGFVINSSSGPITAGEWYLLGGVAVAVAATYGLTNAPASPPSPPDPPVLPEPYRSAPK